MNDYYYYYCSLLLYDISLHPRIETPRTSFLCFSPMLYTKYGIKVKPVNSDVCMKF